MQIHALLNLIEEVKSKSNYVIPNLHPSIKFHAIHRYMYLLYVIKQQKGCVYTLNKKSKTIIQKQLIR